MQRFVSISFLTLSTLAFAACDVEDAEVEALEDLEVEEAGKADGVGGSCTDLSGTYQLTGCGALQFPLVDNVTQPGPTPYGGLFELWAVTDAPLSIAQQGCNVTFETDIEIWASAIDFFDCGYYGDPGCGPIDQEAASHDYVPGTVTQPWPYAQSGVWSDTVAWQSGALRMTEGFPGLPSSWSQAKNGDIDRDGERLQTTFTRLSNGDIRVNITDGPAASWSTDRTESWTCTLAKI